MGRLQGGPGSLQREATLTISFVLVREAEQGGHKLRWEVAELRERLERLEQVSGRQRCWACQGPRDLAHILRRLPL